MATATQDDHQQRAELRIAFLKHLPKRVDQLIRRSRHFGAHGWDINGMSLLHDDVQRLAGTAGRYGALEISQQLLTIETVLGRCLERECLPDELAAGQLAHALDALAHPAGAPAAVDAPETPRPPAAADGTDVPDPAQARSAVEIAATSAGRAERPPLHYWRRWAADAPPPSPIGTTTAAPAAVPPANASGKPAIGAPPAPAAAAAGITAPAAALATPAPLAATPPSAAARPAVPRPAAVARPRRAPARIYHLSDGGSLAVELDQRLETLGDEIEILLDGDELREVLTALAPDLVIVDAGFVGELEAIGTVLRSTRERTGARLPLLAIADEDSMPVRLAARRAGADQLLINPAGATEVLARIDELLDAQHEATFRVLVVEDDRSQGLFAESILRKAGMEARVVVSAFDVLGAMQQFEPDLVLMDLYMPDCDGTELTALIRERDEFLHTPIVFLSGEHDLDKHYEALDAGGDDFLSKPIRPKHLIAAVSNRIRRARAMQRRVARHDPHDHATGLFARSYVLDRINEMLTEDDRRHRPGGLLHIDLDGTAVLRDKLGLTGFEQLLNEVGGLVVGHLDPGALCCRLGDGGFLVVADQRGDDALDALATAIRTELVAHPFAIGGRPLRLRPAIGIAGFRLGAADAGTLLTAAERAARDARTLDRGVLAYEPPKPRGHAPEDALVAQIRHAIEHDGFELLYQPIVAMQGGDESQYQTLLRLRDEAGRLHPAAAIVPLAEQADLMLDVDRWVMAQALRTIEMRHGSPLRLFVNQAASSLAVPDHADWVAAQLAARGVSGEQLVIELGRDELQPRLDAVIDCCERLAPRGVQFCLSRFDTADDGEALLAQLPVSFIKLSARYLGAVQAQGLRDELRTLVDRAHRRGLYLIAQRVEDAQSAATLWMSGIDFIQGNLVQQAGRDLNFDFQSAVL